MAADLTAQINIIAVDAASNILRNVGSAFSGLLNNLPGPAKVAVGAIALAGAAVVAVAAKATQMAANFQTGLTSLVTGAGEAKSNLQLVSNGILGIATATGTSTQQLVSGMYMIESAGYHGAAGLAVLKAAAEGAKVGNADLGTVADATTTIMTDFGIKAQNASVAVNTMIATVANGKTTMSALSSALSQILPTASAAKIGLNDTMAAMATMTGEGVPAANAATYLRQTIIALQAPSKGTVTALAGIGLSSTAVANEMHKSLPGALQMITDALAKKFPVGSAAYIAALKNIAGGSKQMQGMLDLTGTHLDTFKANVTNVAGAVKQGGSSITGWAQVQGDFNQKMAQAQEAVEVLMMKIGQQLLPVLTQIVGQVGPVITAFTNWLVVNNVIPRTFSAIGQAVAGAIGFIRGLVSAVVGIYNWFNTWKPLILGVASVITLFFLPALIGAGVQAALSGAKIAASFIAQVVTSGVQAVISAAKVTASFVASMVQAGVQAWIAGPKIIASFVASMVTSGTQAVISAAKVTASFIASMVQAGVQAGIAAAKVAATFVAGMVQAGIQAVITAGKFLASLIPAIISFATEAIAAAATAIPAMITGFIAWAAGAWAAAAATIAATWPILLIIAAIALLVVGIILLVTHWGQVTAFLKGIWQKFTAWFMGALSAIGTFFENIWNHIKDFFVSIWNGIVSHARQILLILATVIFGPIVLIVAFIVTHWTQIKDFLANVWNAILHFAQTTWQNLSTSIGTALMNLWNTIKSWFGNLASSALQWGRDFIQNLINGIMGMISNVAAAAQNVATTIANFLHFTKPERGPLSDIDQWMPHMTGILQSGMAQQATVLGAASLSVAHSIAGPLSAPGGTVAPGSPSRTSGQGGVSIGDIHVHLGDSSSGSAQSQGRTIANVVKQELANALRQQSIAPRFTTGGR